MVVNRTSPKIGRVPHALNLFTNFLGVDCLKDVLRRINRTWMCYMVQFLKLLLVLSNCMKQREHASAMLSCHYTFLLRCTFAMKCWASRAHSDRIIFYLIAFQMKHTTSTLHPEIYNIN